MNTLTIELPDEAYHAALSFTPQERGNLAAVMFTTAHSLVGGKESAFARTKGQAEHEPDDEDDVSIPDYDRETNEDDLAAIGRSLQAEAEGRIISGDVVFARLREQLKKR
ncbi:MAG: hypothetical protein H7Y38_01940 [Armatimonadetes bacterium]|nr:hypothetical protein [Armatimonadota bacterium]